MSNPFGYTRYGVVFSLRLKMLNLIVQNFEPYKVQMTEARGHRLKEERERLGYSQSKLAALCETSKGSQILYEKGRAPTADYLAALDAAGGDVLYVVTGRRMGDALSPARLALAVQIVTQALADWPAPPDPERYARMIVAAYNLIDPNDPARHSQLANFIHAMRQTSPLARR